MAAEPDPPRSGATEERACRYCRDARAPCSCCCDGELCTFVWMTDSFECVGALEVVDNERDLWIHACTLHARDYYRDQFAFA